MCGYECPKSSYFTRHLNPTIHDIILALQWSLYIEKNVSEGWIPATGGMNLDPAKVAALHNLETPKNSSDVRGLL